MRDLASKEVYRLEECLNALAEHHNEVSKNFKGAYPKKPVEKTLASFEKDIESGRSRIEVIEEDGRILGFCKIDLEGSEGKVDYLIVLKETRGKGFGKILLDRAMEIFREKGISMIEVRVVDGNDAIGFYEKQGFRINSHILRTDI